MTNLDLPSKEQLIKKLVSIIDDIDSTEEKVLSALRVLKKYDKELCLKKALVLYNEGARVVAVSDILLGLIPKEEVETMARLDGDFTDD